MLFGGYATSTRTGGHPGSPRNSICVVGSWSAQS
jgi:hypothetical protein